MHKRIPNDARFAYVNAVALHDSGRKAEATRALEAALVRNPNDRELLYAAASYRVEAGTRQGRCATRAACRRSIPTAPRSASSSVPSSPSPHDIRQAG